MPLKTIAVIIGLLAVAVLVGFGTGMGVITITGAIWPFQPSDEDTPREFIPVAVAYLTWAATSVAVFAFGLRLLRRPS